MNSVNSSYLSRSGLPKPLKVEPLTLIVIEITTRKKRKMFPKVLTPLAASLAMVAGLQVSQISTEESEYILEPVDVKALIQDGMTKELLETVGSQIDVYFKMTTVDEVIEALNALT